MNVNIKIAYMHNKQIPFWDASALKAVTAELSKQLNIFPLKTSRNLYHHNKSLWNLVAKHQCEEGYVRLFMQSKNDKENYSHHTPLSGPIRLTCPLLELLLCSQCKRPKWGITVLRFITLETDISTVSGWTPRKTKFCVGCTSFAWLSWKPRSTGTLQGAL